MGEPCSTNGGEKSIRNISGKSERKRLLGEPRNT
jgi:hypothetical protein